MFYTPANHSPKMNSLVHMAGRTPFAVGLLGQATAPFNGFVNMFHTKLINFKTQTKGTTNLETFYT